MIIIQWSDEDNIYLVALPDFPGQKWSTHVDPYAEAAKNGREVLELLIESYLRNKFTFTRAEHRVFSCIRKIYYV